MIFATTVKHTGKIRTKMVKHKFLYILFVPIFLYYLIFKYIPIMMGFVISFKDLRVGGRILQSNWIGFDNYIYLFTQPDVLNVIKNTIEISFLNLVFGFCPPIILAIMLFDIRYFLYKKICQTIIYLPHFFSWVIIYGMVYSIFSTGTGFLNNFMDQVLNMNRVEFFMSKFWFRPLLIGSSIWQGMGWGTVLYLAILSTVNPEIYESAIIDGAGPIRRIINITLPSIMPIVSFQLTMSVGHMLDTNFEQILMFYNAYVYDIADVIDTWVYRIGLGNAKYGIGTALGFSKCIVSMTLLVICNKISRRLSGRGIW